MRGRFAALLLACTACAAAAPQPPPLADFARSQDIRGVRLSPDGETLAVSMRKDGGMTVAFLGATDLGPIAQWNLGEGYEAYWVRWVSNDRIVLRIGKRDGPLDQLYGIPGLYTLVRGDEDITRHWTAGLLGEEVPGKPGWVYDFMPGTSIGTHPQLRQFNVVSGKRSRLMIAPADFGDFVFDGDGKVRYFVGSNRDLTRVVLRRDGEEWTELFRGPEEKYSEEPAMLSEDGKSVYVFRGSAGGVRTVQRLDPASGEYQPVSSDTRYDASELFVSTDRKTLLGVRYEGLRPRMHIVAPEHPEAKAYLSLQRSFGDADLRVIDRSRDGRRWLVSIENDRDPGQVYLYDREDRQARLLYAHREWLDPEELAPMRAATFTARDGTPIDAYLWLPPGREGKKLPLVVRPHGGPFGIRDVLGYDNEAQVLATRGFAVLSMNFRGSGGYGSTFQRQGHGQWGASMIDDMSDAARWAVAEGVADPERMCIFGASYGAYAAMMSVVREPTLYRCAIGYAGMYDIPAMEAYDDNSIYLRNFFDKVYPKSDEERRTQSPARRAAEIRVPVMLAHGTKDSTTPLEQYELMERALRKAGRPVEITLVKSGEGHGFDNEDNIAEFYATVLAFLDRHIGEAR